MQDLSEPIIQPEHTSLHACTLYACMLRPISQPNWVGSERWRYIWNRENIQDISENIQHNTTQACKLACMHPMCLWAQGHISAKLGQIREIKVSMESGEHARPLWAHNVTQAHKLACMHTIFLHAHTQISANFCQITKIKVSMKYHDYFPYVWAYSRSYEGPGGPKKRPKASHRGWRAQNSPPQKLEREVPGRLNILVYYI